MDDALHELAARAHRQLEAGDTGEAVQIASRLVERLGHSQVAGAETGLAEAMTLLARAFEADGDPRAAEQVARSLLGRWAGAVGGPASSIPVRAGTLVGRYLRLQGALEDSVTQLRETVAASASTPVPEVATERVRARSELALTLGDLAARAWSEGRADDSVRLHTAAAELLAPDRTVAARRRRAGLLVAAAQGLARLQRWDELAVICDGCHQTYGADADPETLESAVVAGCLSAQAALALQRPEAALALARTLVQQVPAGHPHAAELGVRVGLVLAAAERETHGSAAAQRVYAGVISALRDSPEPGMRVFLAIALEMDCAMLCQLDEMDGAVEVGRELAQVIAGFPPHEDFATAAECGNRAAERLISYGDVEAAALIGREVTFRTEDRLAGDDAAVRLRGYVICFDALRRGDDQAELERCWSEIVALDAQALIVLDGLAERYRAHPTLRAALVDTYIGRAAVLAHLGRPAEAQQTVRDVLAEFGGDDDAHIQLMLRGLRAELGDG